VKGLPEVTAAPLVIEVEGKTYQFRPFNDESYGSLLRWIRARFFTVAKEVIAEHPELEESVMKNAFDKAANATLQDPDVAQQLSTPDGTALLTWLAIHQDAPTVELSTVRGWLDKPEVLEQLMGFINQVNPSAPKKGVKRKKAKKVKRPRKR